MSTNKENLQPVNRGARPKERISRQTLGKNGTSSVELQREPLRTIRTNVDQNYVAGPAQNLSLLDTKYITFRNRDVAGPSCDTKLDTMKEVKTSQLDTVKEVKTSQLDPMKEVKTSQLDTMKEVKTSQQATKEVKTSEKAEWDYEMGFPQRNAKQKVFEAMNAMMRHSMNIPKSPRTSTPFPSASKIGNKQSDERFYAPEIQGLLDPVSEQYAMVNLNYLLSLEERMLAPPNMRAASRACVINWIVKVHSASDNPAAVVQQACWSLDRYLSQRVVFVDRLQVIAATCFWISCKFYGCTEVTSRKLVKYSNHAFMDSDLFTAEKHLLRKFDFKFHNVVPDDFVPYFSLWCGRSQSEDVQAAATFVSLCGLMMEKTFFMEYPSVIAAASVKTALILLGKTHCFGRLHQCPIYRDAVKKAGNITKLCDLLYNAVNVVGSSRFKYKAIVNKFEGPPTFIIGKMRIFQAFQQ